MLVFGRRRAPHCCRTHVPEHILLFCVASGRYGCHGNRMVVKGLIERDSGDPLAPTKDGRAVLDALLSKRD
jgi:hypothetical protein